MRRIAPFVIFLLFYMQSAAADSGITISKELFIPPQYFVGDIVELVLQVKVDSGRDLQSLGNPQTYPWIVIHQAKVVQTGETAEIRIQFSSYYPGTRSLPPITLGDVILDSVKIHTTSYLQVDPEQFQLPAGQIFLPGTSLLIAMFTGLVLVGPLLILALTGRLHKWFRQISEYQRQLKPYRRFVRSIRELETEPEKMNSRAFYICLTEELRIYLNDRSGLPFRSVTTKDIKARLHDFLDDPELIHQIFTVLEFADTVKFGGEQVDPPTMMMHIRSVGHFVEGIEEFFKVKMQEAREVSREKMKARNNRNRRGEKAHAHL